MKPSNSTPDIIEITSLNDERVAIFSSLTETQLRSRVDPSQAIFIAESPKVIKVALDKGHEPLALLCEQRHITGDAAEIIGRMPGVPVYTGTREVLASLTGYTLTRGVLCAMRRPAQRTAEEVCTDARRIAVLENVVNPTNVGAVFRSAAALNMDAVLLTPDCSDPLYRRSIRVSMGTVFQIPWAYLDGRDVWPRKGMELLNKLGFRTVAMALTEDSVSIDDPQLLSEEKLAVILGTEGDGLAESTISDCDYRVRIPMAHGVDSLNVAAASAVAFWVLGKK